MKIKVIFDGAHNPSALVSLLKTLDQEGVAKFQLLFGCLKEKNFPKMIRLLAPHVSEAAVLTLPTERAVKSGDLVRAREWGRVPVCEVKSAAQGLAFLKRKMSGRSIVVTGSMYLVGAAKKQFKNFRSKTG